MRLFDPTPASPSIVPPARTRVLVVDDHRDGREVLVEVLRVHGFDAVGAASGQEALNSARWRVPDAVLLDLVMPDMNGFEVAKRMRQDTRLRHAFIAAYSGMGCASSRRLSRQAGCDAHIVKPAEVATVLDLLQQACGLAAPAQRLRRLGA